MHSDRGSQYTSEALALSVGSRGAKQSVGSVGVCWDNAVAESFFSTLKKEANYNGRYSDMEEARKDIANYIEIFYNHKRIHSSNGYLTPVEFEAMQPELALAA